MSSISTSITAARRTPHSFVQAICAKPTVAQIGDPPAGLRFHRLPAAPPVRISLILSKPRFSHHVFRASAQLPSGIRPGGSVETDKLSSDVRKRAMDAVDYYGGRVTIGDVSSRAGLKLDEAERALQALAADTGGFLELYGLELIFLDEEEE
ncbi:hypothetical protein KSP40_PGU014010 [Platanthera guangdongensis]|uniref:Uncharacterized protein n=1 Tax=Platanthera guangdongensis TaxID=2320717 RepID=A0ABR2MJP5_9ASPA